MSFLSQLNPQQREAVETTEGPVLILAGAGSGKTRVITYRIAYLIEHRGVMPESILAMTFTNKAASEMAERVDKLVGGFSIAKPVISTFHSFCVRALRRDIEALRIPSTMPGQPPIGHTKSFVIYDESDQQQLVKSIMRRLGIDDKQTTPRSVLGHISWAKNHMLDPQEVYLQSSDPKTERVAQIYEVYRKELRKANALDFDDLLLEAVRLLKAAPEVRDYYNRRFQYVMIDEYQDTNRPQYELMRMLAGTHHNICAVGDEDQSIYSWRGADIRNILEFEQDFPEAKIVRLEQNYRSTQNILQAASAVVANNTQTQRQESLDRSPGRRENWLLRSSGRRERSSIRRRLHRKISAPAAERNDGETPRAAVLYRTNSQSRLFEEAMRRYQLKYHVVGGFSFYERAEIKDMISYLKVIHNPDDSISLLRVINTPVRGIGKATMEIIEQVALRNRPVALGSHRRGSSPPAFAAASLGRDEEFPRSDRRRPRHAGRNLRRALGQTNSHGGTAALGCPAGRGPAAARARRTRRRAQIAFEPATLISVLPMKTEESKQARQTLRRIPATRRDAESGNAEPSASSRCAPPILPNSSNSSSTAPATSSNWKRKTRPRLSPAWRICTNWSTPPWIRTTAAKLSTSSSTTPLWSATPMPTTSAPRLH